MECISDPLISVIIPCYNSEKYINKTIKSLTEQTYKNLQIVCVNDGSTDKTQFLIEEQSKSDTRIELLNKDNGGIESALKQGLTLLKGEFIFLIGHDDTLSEDAIAEALNAFQNNTNLDAVRPDLHFVFEDSSRNFVMQDRRILDGKEAFLETIGNWNIHTFCLWRAAIFNKIKEVDAKGSMNFDELATRYLYLNCRAVGYCTGIYFYFQHAQSVTKNFSIKRFQVLTTDTLLRQLLIKADLYEHVAIKFERYAFNNITNLVNLYFSMKDLNKKDKAYALNLIRNGFNALNKDIVISYFSNFKEKPTQSYSYLSKYLYHFFELNMSHMEKKIEQLTLPKIVDARGNLSFFENYNGVPFKIERIYWIYDVPGGEVRGGHAYKDLQEVIIALSGAFDVVLHDGKDEKKFTLNRSYMGLYVPKLVWRRLENLSTNALALIATDSPYNEEQYIRDFDQYISLINE